MCISENASDSNRLFVFGDALRYLYESIGFFLCVPALHECGDFWRFVGVCDSGDAAWQLCTVTDLFDGIYDSGKAFVLRDCHVRKYKGTGWKKPFFIFRADKPTPKYIQYLGKALPAAIFGMLVVYCLKNVNILTGSYGLQELLAIALVVVLHLWKRNMLLSIAGGTMLYAAGAAGILEKVYDLVQEE